jgi:hypothetical protein
MREPSNGEKLLDLFLLRTRDPEYAVDQPFYTTGSIVAAALMRVAVIAVVTMTLRPYMSSTTTWWVAMLGLWGLGLYPAWLQYDKHHERVERVTEGTLCGSCRHFNGTNQLCMILDEHVVSDEPPCEGEGWEPR